ncbi:MAG: glycerophosphodiester phosphodiesterase [Pseudonocardiales bacterium]|nr:glycerophosphodiester phosphodiesterase [Pseudonocardiales bacterium]
MPNLAIMEHDRAVIRRRVPQPSERPPRPSSPPLVIAHRGASTALAEHTLAAYQAAIDTGADGLECDVRLTRDGHLVCVHDRRVDRTSNGHGNVSELDLARLSALDFSSWREEDWPDSADLLLHDDPYLAGVAPDQTSGGVLTLSTLLELVSGSGRPLQLLIETKHPTRYAGMVEKELIRTLRRFGLAHAPGEPPPAEPNPITVSVMSFAPIALRRVRLLSPDVPTVLLLERLLPLRRRGDLPMGTEIVGPGVSALRTDPGFVARAHRRGHRVFVWTVDSPSDLDFVLSLGVDAVISNDPAAALRARDRTPA